MPRLTLKATMPPPTEQRDFVCLTKAQERAPCNLSRRAWGTGGSWWLQQGGLRQAPGAEQLGDPSVVTEVT
jgi:hypothetical protein